MSVTLRKRKNTDGTTSLVLDIYHDRKRKYEFLNHLQLKKPSNPADRQANKDNYDLAVKIRDKRAHELSTAAYDMPNDNGKNTKAVEWMQSFIDKYKLKDKRNLQGALNRFKDFLGKEVNLTFDKIKSQTVEDYRDYLKQTSKGEGAASYYARFKKMLKAAYKEKLINRNPADDVEKKKLPGARRKDVLTLEEIQKLAKTPTESEFDVKNAFLFCTVTGLRWADVSILTWGDINGREMTVHQVKTGIDVFVNLNDTALKLLGRRGKPSVRVFNLGTADGSNKTLKAWVKRAGISKKITWHNGRHSFGTNLISQGEDVLTVSSMLGHSTLKYTQRYVTASRELKNKASDKLNFDL